MEGQLSNILAMNGSETESLCALENLMNEFFHPATSNARKMEIEAVLGKFRVGSSSWSESLKFLFASENPLTKMFCLSVLEDVIAKRWYGLGQREETIKTILWRYLIEKYPTDAAIIRNKTAKLMADIARSDWPHFYPDFLSNVYELIERRETTSLGLLLLATMIEEFSQPKEHLAAGRKEELDKLLVEQLPTMLNLLGNMMRSIMEQHSTCITSTPPPSPSHSHESLLDKGNDLSNSLQSSFYRGFPSLTIQGVQQSLHILMQCINCLTLIFSWMPADQYRLINNYLLSTIFLFSTFTLCAKNSSDKNQDFSRLGVMSLTCIYELLCKKCVKSYPGDLLNDLFHSTFQLLKMLITEENNGSSIMANLPEEYIIKLIEFLRLFIGEHLVRLEGQKSIASEEFLAIIFQFTFRQKHCDRFISLLEVWNTFTDVITTANMGKLVEKNKQLLINLVSQILHRVQFKFNQDALEELDDESHNDDSETELQHFVHQCLETIVKITEILPNEATPLMCGFLEENLKNYMLLEYYVSKDPQDKPYRLNINESNDIRQLHCTLRDLTTSLKLMGHLSVDFIGDCFRERFHLAKQIVDKLLASVVFTHRVKLSCLQTADPILNNDLADVHSQLLLTIKAFIPWIAQFQSESLGDKAKNNECSLLVMTIVDESINIISSSSSYNFKIIHCAVLCLFSISKTIPSSLLSTLQSVQLLYQTIVSSIKSEATGDPNLHHLCLNIPLLKEDELMLCNIFSNIFLLPWVNVSDSEQEWNTRCLHHTNFIRSLTEPMMRLSQARSSLGADNDVGAQNCLKIILKRTLNLLTSIVNNHKESSTRTIQLLHHGMQEPLELTVHLLPEYLRYVDVGQEMLSLLLAAFDVLRNQMKLTYVEVILQTMLEVISSRDLNTISPEEKRDLSRLLKIFLQMMSLIVQQPHHSIKSLLPGIVSLLLNQLNQLVNFCDDTDVYRQFFQLLHHLMLNNFKYFHSSNFLANIQGLGDGSSSIPMNDRSNGSSNPQERESQLMAILQTYGQSFLSSDLVLFKQNLESLEDLNKKVKLYHRPFFREQKFWENFLSLFMETCTDQSKDILREDMFDAMYNLASVDFDHFKRNFLPRFFFNCGGLDNNQKDAFSNLSQSIDNDLPSFTRNLERITNDIRYYRICNASLSN